MLVLVLGLAAIARAESADEKRVRDELDRQLRQEVRVPPASLEIRFEGIDSDRYELLESSFGLDGKPVASPLKTGKLGQKRQIIFFGIVSPGQHVFEASLTFREVSGPASLFSYVSGYKFKVPYRVTLEAQKGLVLKMKTGITVDDGESDLKKRLTFVSVIEPYMVAKVDDGKLPEPVDAGTPVASAAVTRKRRGVEKPFTRMRTGDWRKKKKKGSKSIRADRMRRVLRSGADGGS